MPTTIREVRARSGLSMMEMSRRMGVDEGHWSKVERGIVRPSREFLVRFEEILGKRPGEVSLLFGIAPDWLVELFENNPETIFALNQELQRTHEESKTT